MVAVRMQNNNMHHHIPVLLNESISALAIRADGIYVDATFGRGGHSEAILKQLNQNGKLLAFDQDVTAIEYGKHSFSNEPRLQLIHSSFVHLSQHLQSQFSRSSEILDGILFDLGISSPQLIEAERGFSFKTNGPLDMRMNTTTGLTAAEWLQSVSETELADVLWRYGEERFSRRIAKAVIAARGSIQTTHQLADVISASMPVHPRDKHPATRSFQAIRIVVNNELNILESSLQQALNALKVGGRLCVISFHSLEDRIVKQFIRGQMQSPQLPRGIAVKSSAFVAKLQSIGSTVKPSLNETKYNPKARSAILRVAEKRS